MESSLSSRKNYLRNSKIAFWVMICAKQVDKQTTFSCDNSGKKSDVEQTDGKRTNRWIVWKTAKNKLCKRKGFMTWTSASQNSLLQIFIYFFGEKKGYLWLFIRFEDGQLKNRGIVWNTNFGKQQNLYCTRPEKRFTMKFDLWNSIISFYKFSVIIFWKKKKKKPGWVIISSMLKRGN